MKILKTLKNKRREHLEAFLNDRFDKLETRIVKELTDVVAYYKAFITRMPCEQNAKLLKGLEKRIAELEFLDLNERIEALEKTCKITRPRQKRKPVKV